MKNYPNNLKVNRQGGQVLMVTVIFFLSMSLAVILGMAIPVANQIKVSSDLETSRRSYATAEVGNEEIYYRLNKNEDVPANLILGTMNATSTAIITDNDDGYTVLSTGLSNTYQRLTKTVFTRPRTVSILYALQIGTSSVVAGNNSNITGDVYVNGSISGLSVTNGSVIAANLVNPTLVESFDISSTTPNQTSIQFWSKSPAVEDLAQSFQISSAQPINALSLSLKKSSGSWSGAVINITNDNGGVPGTTVYASTTLSSGSVSTADFGEPYIALNRTINLTPGVTYWIVVNMPAQSNNSRYLLAGTVSSTTASYSSGAAKTGTWSASTGGSWSIPSSTARDVLFSLYYNGNISTITNVTTSGAPYFQWAREIYSSNAGTGITYCQNSVSTTPAICDDSRPDPTIVGTSVGSNDYTSWESSATSGTTTGSILVDDGASRTLSNTKIAGNLTIDNNGTVLLTGNLWITGTLNMSNNAFLKIDPSMGARDFVVLVDGAININNNGGTVSGSGNANSFIVLVSRCTSASCPSGSVNVSNNGNVQAVIAPYGIVNLSNNANANSVIAKGVTMDNNANIIYNSNLQYFSLTGAGATSSLWSIDSWQEVSE